MVRIALFALALSLAATPALGAPAGSEASGLESGRQSPAALLERGGANITWKRVDVPAGSERVAPLFKKLLEQATKKTSFGKTREKVVLSARVTELLFEEHDDVLRIHCTVVGRIEHGASARSRISFGGSPSKRAELEKQVLGMVAQGLVMRLAQMVRTEEKRAADE